MSPINKYKVANVVAVLITVGTFFILGLFFFVKIPEGNKDILNSNLIVVLGLGMGGVVFYCFNYKKNKEPTSSDYNDYELCPTCNK